MCGTTLVPLMKKTSVVAPLVGQCFLDEEGVHWTVKNLILSDSLEGFFLASLAHGKTSECIEGTIVVAPLEYEALLRTRRLKVTHIPSGTLLSAAGSDQISSIVTEGNSPTSGAIQ